MSNSCDGVPLEECPVCGVVGLSERIAVHDCVVSEARTATRRSDVSSTEDSHTSEDDATEADPLNEGKACRMIQGSEGER